ncbi:ABC transporter permease [Fulvivirga sp.]|uniref:ABC transporter permease n=1 Tax=Fulvivirga sp. TaxID=1931237 RepID=UPI0032EDAD41
MTSQNRPPKFAQWLLNIFCRADYIEDLIGDLDEEYAQNLKSKNRSKAAWLYYKEVFSLILSYALVKRKKDHSIHPYSTTQNNIAMLKNYFLVAYRNLVKQRFFTAVNIIGLSIGMSISLITMGIFSDILDYDKFHSKRDNIYRFISRTYDQNRVINYATSPTTAADFLYAMPEVEEVVRINRLLIGEVMFENKGIDMNGFFVDPNFFSVFSFNLESGNPEDLNNPNNIFITKSEAYKLFSETDPIGKTVTISPYGDFIVTGILSDPPKKSHIQFDIIGSYKKLALLESENKLQRPINSWDNLEDNYTYFLMREDTDVATIQSTLNKIAADNQELTKGYELTLSLQSMNDVNLSKELRYSIGPQWDIISMIMIVVISLLILVPACLNYANISIARALKRAREIGVRKVVGGNKNQIFMQFIVETILICLLSFGVAYIMFLYLRNEFIGILAPASASGILLEVTPSMLMIFLAFVLLTGFLIGIIPALHFAKIKPLSALSSRLPTRATGKINFKKILLTIQFVISLGFIMFVVIIVDQYRYSINYNMGFNNENILNMPLKNVEGDIWKTEATSLSEVSNLSFSSNLIGVSMYNHTWVMDDINADSILVFQTFVDQQFIDIHDLQLLAGENFPNEMPKNEMYIIVNEQFVNKLGYKSNNEAIGKTVELQNNTMVQIVGVLKDFHFSAIREKIKPFILRYDPSQFTYANMKIASNDIFASVSNIEKSWKKYSQQQFEAKFLNEEIDEAYQWYYAFVKMIGFLGMLAITISCLGLLGMVVFNVENRTKEVGIRKVHGASASKIVFLLSKGYIKIIVIAIMITVPITSLLLSTLLPYIQHYNKGVSVIAVVLSVVILIAISFATIASQTWKAAQSNPADTLRYE